MRAPDWYDAWCEEAFAAFTAKQKRVAETYRLDSWHRYDYDAKAGVLTFSDLQGPRVTAAIQIAGETGESDWTWGWSNPEWPAEAVSAVAQVRAFGAENGIEELLTDDLSSDDLEGLGWMLTAIAARVVDAEGAYRVPVGSGALYLLIRSLKFVS